MIRLRRSSSSVCPVSGATTNDVSWLPRTLSHHLLGLSILKAVLLQIAQGDLHPLAAIRRDNRFLGNQFPQILADGVLHPLIVPQTVFETTAAELPR